MWHFYLKVILPNAPSKLSKSINLNRRMTEMACQKRSYWILPCYKYNDNLDESFNSYLDVWSKPLFSENHKVNQRSPNSGQSRWLTSTFELFWRHLTYRWDFYMYEQKMTLHRVRHKKHVLERYFVERMWKLLKHTLASISWCLCHSATRVP